jgi:hypothetical protein
MIADHPDGLLVVRRYHHCYWHRLLRHPHFDFLVLDVIGHFQALNSYEGLSLSFVVGGGQEEKVVAEVAPLLLLMWVSLKT